MAAPSVHKNHAMINRKKGRVMLIPLNGSDTKINGRKATHPHEIFTGDTVSFGEIEASVYIKPQEEEEPHDNQA